MTKSMKDESLSVMYDRTIDNGKREVPSIYLSCDQSMHSFFHYNKGDYRFFTYVPTTIFNHLVAVIRVYKVSKSNRPNLFPTKPELIVATETVPLESMPKWNDKIQRIAITKRDMGAIKRASEQLENKLLEK